MRTKERTTNRGEVELELDDRVAPIPQVQVLDDQTPIDDLEKSKRGKAKKDQQNLQGFDKRLTSGVEREIRINRGRLGDKNPIVIMQNGKTVATADEIKVEGESELIHQLHNDGCSTVGSVCVRTSSSILTKKKK